MINLHFLFTWLVFMHNKQIRNTKTLYVLILFFEPKPRQTLALCTSPVYVPVITCLYLYVPVQCIYLGGELQEVWNPWTGLLIWNAIGEGMNVSTPMKGQQEEPPRRAQEKRVTNPTGLSFLGIIDKNCFWVQPRVLIPKYLGACPQRSSLWLTRKGLWDGKYQADLGQGTGRI